MSLFVMLPPLIGGCIKRCFCLTSVAYIRPKSRTERPRKTIIGTEVAHVTSDSDTTLRSKGQGHQVALLSLALTHKAAAAVSVGTYSAWESTATLRLLGGARAPTGGRRGAGHIVTPRSQLVLFASLSVTICSTVAQQ